MAPIGNPFLRVVFFLVLISRARNEAFDALMICTSDLRVASPPILKELQAPASALYERVTEGKGLILVACPPRIFGGESVLHTQGVLKGEMQKVSFGFV